MEGQVSDSSPADQDVDHESDAHTSIEAKLLSTGLEDAALEDAEVSSHLEMMPAPMEPSTTAIQSARRPGPEPAAEKSDAPLSVEEAKAYVARQVSRWEQVWSERVLPPNVEYVWLETRPNTLSWLSAMLAVSMYLLPEGL